MPSEYSGVQPGSNLQASQASEEEPNTEQQLYEPPKTLSRRVRYFFLGDGLDKKRLQQLGMPISDIDCQAVTCSTFISGLVPSTGQCCDK